MEREIKANELRVNNLVYYNNEHKEIGTVSGIKTDCLGNGNVYLNERIDITYPIEHIKPIPITEEWLLKSRFYKEEREKGVFIHEDLDVTLKKHGNKYAFVIWSEECPSLTQYIMHCEYVHTLQNNVKSFTKSELTLKQ